MSDNNRNSNTVVLKALLKSKPASRIVDWNQVLEPESLFYRLQGLRWSACADCGSCLAVLLLPQVQDEWKGEVMGGGAVTLHLPGTS